MNTLVAAVLLSFAGLIGGRSIWCGYLFCNERCDESFLGNDGCPLCRCTCGASKCMPGYSCRTVVHTSTKEHVLRCCMGDQYLMCLEPGNTQHVDAKYYLKYWISHKFP